MTLRQLHALYLYLSHPHFEYQKHQHFSQAMRTDACSHQDGVQILPSTTQLHVPTYRSSLTARVPPSRYAAALF